MCSIFGANGLESTCLEVKSSNKRAKNFYKSPGFVPVKDSKVDFPGGTAGIKIVISLEK